MTRKRLLRRRFLALASTGLATSLAGCNSTTNSPNQNAGEVVTPATTSGTEDDEVEMPEEPSIAFRAPSTDFSFFDLPVHEKLPNPTDLGNRPDYPQDHPDNRAFNLTITETNATLVLPEAIVNRATTFTLHVRDANHTFQSVSESVEPTTDDQYHELTLEFDLTDITLPREAGGFTELTMTDSHPGNPYTVTCKRHWFVGIPHKQGTEWVNHEVLDYTHYTDDDGVPRINPPRGIYMNGDWPSRVEKPAGFTKHIDTDDERIVILATRTQQGEVYGVSAHVEHDPAKDFKNGNDRYQYTYGEQYEAHFATEISHFRELAEKTSRAIDRLGISRPRTRLEAVGDLIQMLSYEPQWDDPAPTVVLYDSKGDCSSKSILLACILQNDPWNIRTGYIDCKINGVGHWTLGIDVRDIEPSLSDGAFTISPSDDDPSKQDFPDTAFAFWDMTYDAYIGERTEGVSGPFTVYDEGDFKHHPGRRSNDSPDY